MLRHYRLIKQADAELTRIMLHYERERDGLGFQFFECYEAAAHQAMRFPEAGDPIGHKRLHELGLRMRRVQVERFPHYLVTTTLDDVLVIVAIAHHKRRPGYWFTRLAKVRR